MTRGGKRVGAGRTATPAREEVRAVRAMVNLTPADAALLQRLQVERGERSASAVLVAGLYALAGLTGP